MAEKRDYYNVLGLGKDATPEQIKEAYKNLAKKYHPDVSSEANAEEKFKEVLEAYSVLSDPEKKTNYDQFGFASEGFTGFRGFGDFGREGAGFGDFSTIDFDFEDLFRNFGFEDIFGEGERRERRTPRRGYDIRYDLTVSFEDAAFGAEKEIFVERVEDCGECRGKGAIGKEDFVECEKCKGKGYTQHTQRTFFGTFSTQSTCRKCRGEGRIIRNACKKCNGLGKIRVKKKVKVRIPEGAINGMTLRMHGEGNAGERGGESGDLFVVVFIEPHEVFKRDRADIFTEMPITFSMAAIGGELEAPTLKGKARIKVPAGTQTGTIFKLKGNGVKNIERGGYGDEYVKVIVRTPKHLNKKEKELFEQLSKEEKENIKENGFFKSFWQ